MKLVDLSIKKPVTVSVGAILLLLFGEIVPKTLGLRKRRFLAVNAAPVDVLRAA